MIIVSVFILVWAINLYPAKLNNLNFHPLEVVSRYRDPQLQVAENYCYLFNLTPKIWKSLNTDIILKNWDLIVYNKKYVI